MDVYKVTNCRFCREETSIDYFVHPSIMTILARWVPRNALMFCLSMVSFFLFVFLLYYLHIFFIAFSLLLPFLEVILQTLASQLKIRKIIILTFANVILKSCVINLNKRSESAADTALLQLWQTVSEWRKLTEIRKKLREVVRFRGVTTSDP